jgi:dTMP kinase
MVSGFGDWMATVALMALVLDLSGSATAVAGVLVLRLAPAMVAGPVAGWAARRWDGRRLMVGLDVARAAVALAIPLVAQLWWVYACAFAIELGGIVFVAARDAAVPHLVQPEELALANGLVMGSSYGTIPLGAGAFAIVAALSGTGGLAGSAALWLVFAVDAASYLVSAALLARIRILVTGVTGGPDAPPPVRFLDALRVPLVRVIGPVALVAALGLGALFSMGLVFVRDVVGAGTEDFAILVVLFGVGAALGLPILRSWRGSDLTLARWAVVTQGAVIALISVFDLVPFVFAGATAFGAATAVALAAAVAVVQSVTDDEDRMAVLTVFHAVIRGGLAGAALVTGAAADLMHRVTWPVVGSLPPARVILFCSGVVVLAATASTSWAKVREPAREDGVRLEAEPEG